MPGMLTRLLGGRIPGRRPELGLGYVGTLLLVNGRELKGSGRLPLLLLVNGHVLKGSCGVEV